MIAKRAPRDEKHGVSRREIIRLSMTPLDNYPASRWKSLELSFVVSIPSGSTRNSEKPPIAMPDDE